MSFSEKVYFLTILILFNHISVFGFDVLIINSKDIIPYNESIEGIKQSLDTYSIEVFNMEEDMEKGKNFISKNIHKTEKLFVGIGPQAAFLLSREKELPNRIFSMVLNPENLFGVQNIYYGISLNLPVEFQLAKIKKAFPDRTTLGVFYCPEFNQKNFDNILIEAEALNLKIRPFKISSASEIPKIVQSEKFLIDALFVIPDIQLEDTRIIEFVIRECLKRKIPVIGYNKWFSKNGAVLSFFIDYKDIGIQTGDLSIKIMDNDNVNNTQKIYPPAKIDISVNLKTARRLGVEVSPHIIETAGEVTR